LKRTKTNPDILVDDSSDFGMGGVLSQIQDNPKRVNVYAIHALSKAEKINYITTKELLAVVYFVQYLGHFLLG
jgi:hypothetical protein